MSRTESIGKRFAGELTHKWSTKVPVQRGSYLRWDKGEMAPMVVELRFAGFFRLTDYGAFVWWATVADLVEHSSVMWCSHDLPAIPWGEGGRPVLAEMFRQIVSARQPVTDAHLSVAVDVDYGGIGIWWGTTELYRAEIVDDPLEEARGVLRLVAAIAFAIDCGAEVKPGIECEVCRLDYGPDHDCYAGVDDAS